MSYISKTKNVYFLPLGKNEQKEKLLLKNEFFWKHVMTAFCKKQTPNYKN